MVKQKMKVSKKLFKRLLALAEVTVRNVKDFQCYLPGTFTFPKGSDGHHTLDYDSAGEAILKKARTVLKRSEAATQSGVIKAVYIMYSGGRGYDDDAHRRDMLLIRKTIGDAPLFVHEVEAGCVFATGIPVPGDEVDFIESHGLGEDEGFRLRMRDHHEALRASDDDEVPEVELTEPKNWVRYDHLADWLIEAIGQL
jgi:hypothetical protein